MTVIKDGVGIFILVLAGLVLVFVLYLGWATLIDGYSYKPVLEFQGERFQPLFVTMRKFYHPGETVRARMKFHKNRNIQGCVQWNLVDHVMTRFAPRTVSLPAGVWDLDEAVEQLPNDVVPGKYYFVGVVHYHVNTFNTVSYQLRTTDFIVLSLGEELPKAEENEGDNGNDEITTEYRDYFPGNGR